MHKKNGDIHPKHFIRLSGFASGCEPVGGLAYGCMVCCPLTIKGQQSAQAMHTMGAHAYSVTLLPAYFIQFTRHTLVTVALLLAIHLGGEWLSQGEGAARRLR